MTNTFVLILNFNGRTHLEICLPSVIEAVGRQAQVVVVDNHSSDDSRSYVAAKFPSVYVLDTGGNLGFAEGNNVGIRYALSQDAKYVALLNNDTRVDKAWLSELLMVAESDPEIAICESQQYTWDGQKQIRLLFLPEYAAGDDVIEDHVEATSPYSIPFASGCCMLLRSKVLDLIGLFDPRYFIYAEDVDLSLRAWIAGFKVLKVPRSVVYHRVGGASTPRQAFLGYRNQLHTLLKNYEVKSICRFAWPILRRWVLCRNATAHQAALAVLANFPETLRQRQIVQRLRRRHDSEIFSICS